ncbi:MAG: 1,4-dihydroxy-6-naphthoate synthase [Desulfuromonadaceae bacterium]|nr:1,4-dihydroxy-6-naphthoate synthase [Desulfuromonadaceae bacterium]
MPDTPLTLTLGYSPCPNDTFIFDALVHGRIPCEGVRFQERLEDVETLNQLAKNAQLDLTKISYHALGHLREQYVLLRSGGALGRGCGPLVVSTTPLTMEQLRHQPILIPGELTTANLLLQLHGSGFEQVTTLPFDRIMPTLLRGEARAGVIIHESRFTFADYGLHQVLDLGQWWEQETGLPIPLGGILARRSLPAALIARIDAALQRSVLYARQHPQAAQAYIRQHAQELSDQVTQQHIDLYVNDFSVALGHEGEQAVRVLLQRAEQRGLIPPCALPLFAESE